MHSTILPCNDMSIPPLQTHHGRSLASGASRPGCCCICRVKNILSRLSLMPELWMREKLECSCHATLSKVSCSHPTAQMLHPQFSFIACPALLATLLCMPEFSVRLVSKRGDTHTARSWCLAVIESHEGSQQPNRRDCGVALLCADGGASKSGGLVLRYCSVPAKNIYSCR